MAEIDSAPSLGSTTAAPLEEAPRLEIRLLGGFEIMRGGETVSGFESQSSRAILAYLACHPDRSVPREVLTDLLWPEAETAAARHNLRQALYNLRGALAAAGVTESPLVTTFRTVGLEPRAEVWVDVREYRDHLAQGRPLGAPLEPHALTRAVALYRGDFLAGFYVRDSPDFEQWMLDEQERLREEALAALRDLVVLHTEIGTYALAIQYAHSYLRLDRFSEDTHRQLMRLYALSGRRSRAIAHFSDLKTLLSKELGVAPARETQELLLELESEPDTVPADAAEDARAQPIVPLVGREGEFGELRRQWRSILEHGAGALTLLGGEAGVGKTRLVKAFLDRETGGRVRILQGRCYQDGPLEAYQPIAEAVRNAIRYESDVAERVLAAAGRRSLGALAGFVPALAQLLPSSVKLPPATEISREALFPAVGRLLELLVDKGSGEALSSKDPRKVPLVLFLEDLHDADAATFDLILALLPRLALHPIWILGTYRPEALTSGHPLGLLPELYGGRTPIHYLTVDRPDPEAFAELAGALVGGGLSGALADWLHERSGGLPLMAVELINWLWSQRELVPLGEGRWTLASGRELLAAAPHLGLDQLILQRIGALPTSARRLLTLASVIGPTFEGTLLRDAENEHEAVVATGLQILGEQWLAHPFPHYWADTRRDRDRAGYAAGAALHGTFEFTHQRIRSVAYELLDQARARGLHRRIAQAIEKAADGRLDEVCETLAHHYQRAGETTRAVECFERSAYKALKVEGFDLARRYLSTALAVLDSSSTMAETGRRHLRQRLVEALAALPASPLPSQSPPPP